MRQGASVPLYAGPTFPSDQRFSAGPRCLWIHGGIANWAASASGRRIGFRAVLIRRLLLDIKQTMARQFDTLVPDVLFPF